MKYNNIEISVKLFEKKFNGHRICDMSVMFRNYLLDFICIYIYIYMRLYVWLEKSLL